jgi:hypothetical protein
MIHTLSAEKLARLMNRMRPLSMSIMCLLMVAMVSVSSTLAMAQDQLRPPKTTEQPSGPKYVIFGVAVLLTAMIVFAATLKSKRTHQD